MSKLRSLTVWLILYLPLGTPVLAQSIAVDKTVSGPQPEVGSTNGVPVVNIAPPGAGGVSNNAFTHFNVGSPGVVLNNSRAASQTQLAGQVNGNPLLGDQLATTILNQVTAPNPSQLLGTLEVAGQRANVIVANPAGITCNGCGFLNAHRATLTTGRPHVGPDGSIGFDVASGTILIDGAGLNSKASHRTTLGQVDLIARSLQIHADVWADRLNVVAGTNYVDYGSEQVKEQAATGSKPTVAVDTAALGAMYANSIWLIATEQGVGVNLSGHLAALTGEIQLSVAGEVRIVPSGTLRAGGDLKISAASGLDNAGKLLAGVGIGTDIPTAGQGSVKLEGRYIFNTGAIAAGKDVTLEASSLDLIGGSLSTPNKLALNTPASYGAIRINGARVSGGTVDLQAAHFDSVQGEVTARDDLTITVKKALNNQGGKLTAGGNLTALAAYELNNKQGTLSGGGTTSLSTHRLVNTGGVIRGKTVLASIERRGFDLSYVDNTRGLIQAAETLTLNAERVGNQETQSSDPLRPLGLVGQTITLMGNTLRSEFDNTRGSVAASEKLTLQTRALENGAGILSSSGVADIQVSVLNNAVARNAYVHPQSHVQGKVSAVERLTIDTTALEGTGTLHSEGDLFLTIQNDPKRQILGRSARGELMNQSKIFAGRDLTVHAVALNNLQRGELVALGATTLNIEQTLSNKGVIDGGATLIKAAAVVNQAGGRIDGGMREIHQTSGAGSVRLFATQYVTLAGEIKAKRDVHIDTAGPVFVDGLVQAGSELSVKAATEVINTGRLLAQTEQGSIRLQAPVIKTPGSAKAVKSVTLIADQLALAGATLSTPGQLVLHTAGDIHTDQATLEGTALELRARNLYNAGGNLRIPGDLTATLSGLLDNTGGVITAQNIVANATGPVLNTAGLIQAAETLTLNTHRVENRDTRSIDPLRPLGLVGKTLQLTSDQFDNARGSVAASQALTLTTQALETSAGTLRSDGELSLTVKGPLNQSGTLSSGGGMAVSVVGPLDNTGQVSSSGDLTITTTELHNATSGELVARGAHTLTVAQTLTNEGLIDGSTTRIDAVHVSNQGRLYGDTLTIHADTLSNEVGPTGAAILASHGDMDLGVATLINREHALIYAGGDLRVGGDLSTNYKALGQATWLVNSSATIEVAGHAEIAATSIQNQNAHYASTVVTTSVTPKVYYRPEGTTEWYDGQTTWLCDLVTPLCSKDPEWLDNDQERRLLRPSARYPESRYGPPFDYAPSRKGRRGIAAPIWPAMLSHEGLVDDRSANWSKTYPAESKVWGVFGVNAPSGTPLNAPAPQQKSDSPEVLQAKLEAQRAYDVYLAPVRELDQRIRSFNADFDNNRMVKNFAIHRVNEIVHESRTLTTDPGLVLVNGKAILNGTVVNDKSQIVAGDKLTVNGPAIRNLGATGERRVEHEGTSTRTYERKDERRYDPPQSYRAVIAVEPIELPVAVATGGQPGQRDAALTINRDHQGFTVRSEADAPYLVATDPRLVGQREVVSSDLLFDLLHRSNEGSEVGQDEGRDPASDSPIGKRLGDGFYEQQLVSEQIRVATGQRFLAPFSDNDAQYRALLSAGAQLAKAEGLKVGEPLTPAQIRQLTTDRAWLVKQAVTLADGTTQEVLVPKVYLKTPESESKRSAPSNLPSGGGTLLGGHEVNLAAATNLANSGTIGARDAAVLTASDLINHEGGRIQGSTVELMAKEDLTNQAATILGETVSLRAGRDVVLASTVQQEHQSDRGQSYWSSAVSGVARVEADRLDVKAQRDITLTAAQITARDEAHLAAGRDLTLGTVTQAQEQSAVYGTKNRMAVSVSSEVGTTIAAEQALTLAAGQDVHVRAGDVTAGGALTVEAGRDIHLAAGEAHGSAHDERAYKTSGFLSSKKTHTVQSVAWTQAQGSTLTGDSVLLAAGRDLNVVGSQVGAQQDLTLAAKGDIAIVAETNTVDAYHYEQVKKSGVGALGGVSYGRREQTDRLAGQGAGVAPSTVGSVVGDVQIHAGQTVEVVGSRVLAPQGDVTVSGQALTLAGAMETAREEEHHIITQSGLTVSANTPVMNALRAGQHMGEASGQLGNAAENPVLSALAGLTTGLAAKNAYDAVMADPAHVGGASVMVSVGSSKSRSHTERASSRVQGSTVAAGRDLRLLAQGAGEDSDITVTGSTLSAGQNAVLKAEGDVLLQAGQNQAEQHTDSQSSSTSLGAGWASGQRNGLTLELGVSAARGHAEGQDVSWTPSRVTASKVLAMHAGGDMTFKGAQGQGESIVAAVGNDLLLESLQDTRTYRAKQSSTGVSASLCVPPFCYGASSMAVNIGRGKMKSDFSTVTEQSGLRAGDGGFEIDVQANTRLVGAVIASNDRVVADGRNRLSTGTLSTEDIENKAEYSASQVSLGAGHSGGGQPSDLGTTKAGQVAGGASKEHGTSIPTSKDGLGVGMPLVATASGESHSTTQSGISQGAIDIRDEAAQQALTGMTPDETIASLNRDTTSTEHALKPIFDKQKIEAGFEIVQAFQQQAGQFLTNRAQEIDALKSRGQDSALTQAERDQALAAALKLEGQWGPSGAYRRVLSALSAGAAGNVASSSGAFIQSAAVNYLQGLSASEVKKIADSLGEGPKAEAVRTSLHAIVGCAGAAGSNGACSAGALGAGLSSVFNALLSQTSADTLSAQEKEAQANLVTSLVGATTLATGREAIGAMVAARTETENNYLAPSEVKQMIGELVQCRVEADGAACRSQVKEKFEQLSMAKGGGKLYGCKGEGESACHAQRLQNQAGSKELEVMEGLGSSGPEYVVMDGRVIMNGYGWSPGEYTVIDSLLNLNWNDERISHNAWLESFYQEAGAPIAIGAGIAVGTALHAERTAVKTEAQLAGKAVKAATSVGSEIKLADGFYQAEGSAFKFSESYYHKLWSTGRGAPFLQAEEVLNTAKTVTPDRMAGFNRYVNDAFEMVYNPITKEVWHLQPIRK